MQHKESNMQQQCVAWFRAQYQQYAMLMVHPINEGCGHSTADRRRQGIHKAEGAVPGVPDLLFFMPSDGFAGMGIELKTPSGRQSQPQRDFQQMFQAAGYMYVVVRSLDEFKKIINDYIAHVDIEQRKAISLTCNAIFAERDKREREKFIKFLNSK